MRPNYAAWRQTNDLLRVSLGPQTDSCHYRGGGREAQAFEAGLDLDDVEEPVRRRPGNLLRSMQIDASIRYSRRRRNLLELQSTL